jgi:hypothetical protein
VVSFTSRVGRFIVGIQQAAISVGRTHLKLKSLVPEVRIQVLVEHLRRLVGVSRLGMRMGQLDLIAVLAIVARGFAIERARQPRRGLALFYLRVLEYSLHKTPPTDLLWPSWRVHQTWGRSNCAYPS